MFPESKLEALMLDTKFVVVSNTDTELIIRSSISTEEEAHAFVRSYEKEFTLQYNVLTIKYHPKRSVFNKTWTCHHSLKNKYKPRKGTSKKNTNCKSSIKVAIEVKSANNKWAENSPPLLCLIVIKYVHNHPIAATDNLQMFTPTEDIKQMFYTYFDNGMSVAEAKRFHESKLMREDAPTLNLINASINPKNNQVSYLLNRWKKNTKDVMDPLKKLNDKIKMYEESGICVKVDETDPWAALIVTPFMRRSQRLPSSNEVIFVDSAVSYRTTRPTVPTITTMLAVTQAGAVPIAVFVHRYQTAENYKKAFCLLKQNFPKAFGFEKNPVIFLTEDSPRIKEALKDNWPSTSQLLCHFHLTPAEWRWLSYPSNNVSTQDRKKLMILFQTVLCADTEEKLDLASEDIFEESEKHPEFVQRFGEFLKRKHEWALFCRPDIITKHIEVINFAEATVRVLKDTLANRTKGFNVIAFVEFCSQIWEQYLVSRLLKHAHNEIKTGSLLYEDMCSKIVNCSPSDLEKLDDATFCVSKREVFYAVDSLICSCFSGQVGGFCQHQRSVCSELNLKLPSPPELSFDDRFTLAQLALGEKCPERELFLTLKEENKEDTEASEENASNQMQTPSVVVKERRKGDYEKAEENQSIQTTVSLTVERDSDDEMHEEEIIEEKIQIPLLVVKKEKKDHEENANNQTQVSLTTKRENNSDEIIELNRTHQGQIPSIVIKQERNDEFETFEKNAENLTEVSLTVERDSESEEEEDDDESKDEDDNESENEENDNETVKEKSHRNTMDQVQTLRTVQCAVVNEIFQPVAGTSKQNLATEEDKKELLEEFDRIIGLIDSSIPKFEVIKLTEYLKTIQNTSDINVVLSHLNRTFPSFKESTSDGRVTKVKPTPNTRIQPRTIAKECKRVASNPTGQEFVKKARKSI